MIQRDSNLQN